MRSVGMIVVLALSACGYRGGTFADRTGAFGDERVTVGCLDVGVTSHTDAAAEGPVIAYAFGNHCRRAATVDLGAVVATGRTVDGREVALAPYDPYGELQPARLESRRTGREAIEYHADDGAEVRLICVDLAALDGEGGASQVVCVDAAVAL